MPAAPRTTITVVALLAWMVAPLAIGIAALRARDL